MEYITSTITRIGFNGMHVIAPPRLSILIFHRVHAKLDPIFPSEPDAKRFNNLISFIAKTFNVMSLGQAAEKLVTQKLPPRSLVITFDDGYADNIEVATPILLHHGVVGTFFISTGFLDGGRMWNDSVIECFRSTTRKIVDLEHFGLGQITLKNAESRRNAIDSVLPKIKYMSLAEREEAVANLKYLCGVSSLPSNLMMKSEQVRELHDVGMECGGHTVNHPILQSIALEEARIEIENGKRHLESTINAPIKVFAYPNGRPNNDYSHEHVRLLKDIGFSCAVTTAKGAAQYGDDIYQLPRYSPWEKPLARWSAKLFMNQFCHCFPIASPLPEK